MASRLIVALALIHASFLCAALALPERLAAAPSWAYPTHIWSALGDILALARDFLPWLLAPFPLWLIFAAFSRPRPKMLAVALLPAALFVLLYGELYVPRPPHALAALERFRIGAEPPAARLRVMSLNALYANGAHDATIASISRSDPDLLFVQELNPGLRAALDAALRTSHPHSIADPDDGPNGMGLWSRFPIRTPRDADGPPLPSGPRRQHVTAEIGRHQVHLVHLHLPPPEVYFGTVRRLPIPLYAGQSARERDRELESLLPTLRALSHHPLILAGDLNATDTTPAYRALRRVGLRDAHRAAGWGLGFTFPAWGSLDLPLAGVPIPPVARIDYVLHSAALSTRAATVLPDAAGADHLPVIAELFLW